MKTNQIKVNLITLALGSLVLFSCTKEDTGVVTTAESELMAGRSISTEVDEAVDNATFQPMPKTSLFDPCVIISNSAEDGAFPNTITLDFGEGCTGQNGKVKSGKIIITVTDFMKNVGAMRTISFENFYVNGNQVTGQKLTVNNGENESGNVVMVTTNQVSMTNENGEIMMREGQREREWIAGFSTEDRSDDEFLVTGSFSGTRPNGGTMTREIIDPLHISYSCKYPLSGVAAMSCSRGEATVDFGNGVCDNEAEVTRNGNTEVINLDETRFGKRRGRRHRLGS